MKNTRIAVAVILAASVFADALTVIPPVFAASPSENLISNPRFETTDENGNPLGWQSGSWGNADTAVFTYPVTGIDPDSGVPGGNAAQVTISSYGTDPGGGDAKWYFNDTSVQYPRSYAFSDWYKSDTTSYLAVRYRLNDGSFQYEQIAMLPPTPVWTNATRQINPPLKAVSATVFHLINSNGTLTTDNYSLAGSNADVFPRGMVSLTFDDGWYSQYANALPVLQKAGMRGTFYILSQSVLEPAIDLFSASKTDMTISSTTRSVTWEGVYPDPNQTSYRFKDSYSAEATSILRVNYTLPDNSASSTLAGIFPGASTTQNADIIFTLPILAPSTPISLSHSIEPGSGGSFMAEDASLFQDSGYMNVAQVQALQSAGNEIGAHTQTHPDLTSLSVASATREISGSRIELLSSGFLPVDTFAYPYGLYNSTIKDIVAGNGFVAGRSVDEGFNSKNADKFTLKVKNVNSSITDFSAEIKPYIDAAVADKLWLILVFHQIDDRNILAQKGETEGTTPEMFRQIVDYLKNNNIDVVTIHDAVALMNPADPPSRPATPAAIPAPGIYNSAQNVSLSSDNSAFIRYTTDSTVPTCTAGNLYAGPIAVSIPTTIHAIGCAGDSSSAVADLAYAIDEPLPQTSVLVGTAFMDGEVFSPGESAAITTNVRSTTASTIILDTEIWKDNAKINQRFLEVSVAPNQTSTSVWNLTLPIFGGSYAVKIGTFAKDWGALYSWNDSAASFRIGTSTPFPIFNVSASFPTRTLSPGATSTLTTSITSDANLPDALIDTEIFDSNGIRVLQNIVPADLASNILFTSPWNLNLPSAPGSYMAKVGVFSRNWNTLYKWEDRVLPFAVGTLEDSPQPVDIYDISILSPQNNQNVSGTVELRAAIDNLDVQSYDMGWRTGTGEFIPMQTDPTFSFKRAWIDFTPWNWRSDSIYPIQLQASDANDNVIANTTINVIH